MSELKITTGRTGLVLRSTAGDEGRELNHLSQRYLSGVVLEYVPEERLIRSYVKVVRYDDEQFYAEYRFDPDVEEPLRAYQSAVRSEVADAEWRIETGVDGNQEVFDALDDAPPEEPDVDLSAVGEQLREGRAVDFNVPDGRAAVSLLRALLNHSAVGDDVSYVVCNGGLPNWYDDPHVIIVINDTQTGVTAGRRSQKRLEEKGIRARHEEATEALRELVSGGDDRRTLSWHVNESGLDDRLDRRLTAVDDRTLRSSFYSAASATGFVLLLVAVPTVLYFVWESLRSVLLSTVTFGEAFRFGSAVASVLEAVGLGVSYPLWQILSVEGAILIVVAGAAIALKRSARSRGSASLSNLAPRLRSTDAHSSGEVRAVVDRLTAFADEVRDAEYAYTEVDEATLTEELDSLVSDFSFEVVDAATYRRRRFLGILFGVGLPLLFGFGCLYFVSRLLNMGLALAEGSRYVVPAIVYVLGILAILGVGSFVVVGVASVIRRLRAPVLEIITGWLSAGSAAGTGDGRPTNVEEGFSEDTRTEQSVDDAVGSPRDDAAEIDPSVSGIGDSPRVDESAVESGDTGGSSGYTVTLGDSGLSNNPDTADGEPSPSTTSARETSARRAVDGSLGLSKEGSQRESGATSHEGLNAPLPSDAHRQARVDAANGGYLPVVHSSTEPDIVGTDRTLASLDSQPLTNGSRIYAVSGNQLFAGRLDDPSDRWRADIEARTRETLAISSGTVYVPTSEGELRTYDVSTGTASGVIWSSPSGSQFVSPTTLTDRRLYTAGSNGTVYGIGFDGECEWHVDLSHSNINRPPLPNDGSLAVDECVTIMMDSGYVEQIEKDGTKIEGFSFDGTPIGPPVMDGQTVHVTTVDAGTLCIDNGEEMWRWNSGSERVVHPPALDDDSVYVLSQNWLHVLDKTDGELRWQYAIDEPPSSPPVVTDNRIYFTKEDGHLVSIGKMSQSQIWTTEVGEICGEPVVTKEHVVVSTDRGLLILQG